MAHTKMIFNFLKQAHPIFTFIQYSLVQNMFYCKDGTVIFLLWLAVLLQSHRYLSVQINALQHLVVNMRR